MLNQNTDKAFDGSKHNAVNHDRTVLFSVRPHIFRLKPHRQLEIQLNRTALPCSADRILQMEVDFRSVKSAVSFVYHIIHPCFFQSATQAFRCQLPILIAADTVFRTSGKLYMIRESELAVYFIDQPHNPLDLICYLFLRHKNMGIILSEAAHTHQSVQLAGFFMTVHKSQFSHAQGKIPVGSGLGFIYQHSARTVHGLHRKFFLINCCGIHVFPVMIPVSGCFPKLSV